MNVLVQRCRAWIVCATIGMCAHAQLAHAGPRTLQVQIGDDEAVHEILVHNAYITELHFPARITRVAATDNGRDYDIEALEHKVLLRPKRNTAPGSVGNLLIESRKWRVVVMFRVAAHASDAVVSVTFKRPEYPEDTPPTTGKDAPVTAKDATEADKPAAQADTPAAQADTPAAQPDTPSTQIDSAAEQAQPASTEAVNDAAEPQDEPASAAELAENPAILRAAPGEPRVSVQVNGTLGRAVIGDRMAGNQTDGLLLAGMAAHVAYPVGRYYAYDAGLTVAGSGMARFPGVMLDHDTGEMLRTMMLTRFELGASARLPVRLSPVVRVGVGVQGRALVASRLVLASGAAVEGPEDELILDLTGSATVGMDYRITRAWRAGFGVTALRAVPLDNGPLFEAWEGSIHVRWN